MGEILVNLNWNNKPAKKGFLGSLFGGGSKPIDLDLGCLYELKNGRKGTVQALGNAFGSLQQEPYIALDGDDRTGAVATGENLRIDGNHIADIKRVLVYTYIYEGVANWQQADAVVTIRYPGAEDDVLHDVSFTARPGQVTAIVGSTGCGKSTLLNLIPRFYDATGGTVSIGGVDVRRMQPAELRAMLGYVPQKGVLFTGDILSNLEFGGDVSEADAIRAAATAQAEDFIWSRPHHFLTPVAQGGANVSGGQRQRLSIARAIARHPQVYLFDDSFSALDYQTDAALRQALAKQTHDATVIIVAQRLSTILHADQILVLDGGRIVGRGTHSALLRSCETYREIALSQLSAAELGEEG